MRKGATLDQPAAARSAMQGGLLLRRGERPRGLGAALLAEGEAQLARRAQAVGVVGPERRAGLVLAQRAQQVAAEVAVVARHLLAGGTAFPIERRPPLLGTPLRTAGNATTPRPRPCNASSRSAQPFRRRAWRDSANADRIAALVPASRPGERKLARDPATSGRPATNGALPGARRGERPNARPHVRDTSPMASADVAAGDGALRTCSPRRPRRSTKSSTTGRRCRWPARARRPAVLDVARPELGHVARAGATNARRLAASRSSFRPVRQ